MHDQSRAIASRVTDEAGRQRVIEVLEATYCREKHWVHDAGTQFPADHLQSEDIAWFVVCIDGEPAGALRVYYDPPYGQYASYGLKFLDPGLRVEEFLRRNRIAEIGRFAVKPEFRSQFMAAAALMRAATAETVRRGFSHFVTDIFESDPHNPYRFHTRVMGFLPVATHDFGELNCQSRRITMVLDLAAAYRRLRDSGNWVFRYFTSEWDEAMHRRLLTDVPAKTRSMMSGCVRSPSPAPIATGLRTSLSVC